MHAHAHQKMVRQAVPLRGYLTFVVVTALLFAAALFVPVASATGTILRVQAGASGANNGTSWANAFPTLQDALAVATSGQQIWVAAGTYYPDEGAGQSNNDRSATFLLRPGVAIYGGFAGTETTLEQRDWLANLTILSGDLDQNDTPNFGNRDNNAYHVVTGANNATLNGFTITGGNANGSDPNDRGGGIYNNNVSPTLRNLTISGNRATSVGGGVYNNSSTPSFSNVTISGNQASGGGGVFNSSSNASFANITISGNRATNDGGGVFNNGGTPSFSNVTLSGNRAIYQGGGVYNWGGTPNFSNSIIWGNSSQVFNNSSTPTYSYSLVQGLTPGGTGNLPGTTNPRFVNPIAFTEAPTTTGNYRLLPTSPVRDVGNNAANSTSTDLDGNPRVSNGTIDLGPYEFQVLTGTIFYVDKSRPDDDGTGTSWDQAFRNLQTALLLAGSGAEIWVAAGTYYPDEGAGQINNDRSATFLLRAGLAVYGGFVGHETALEQRDWLANLTILSGDLQQNDAPNFGNRGDNAYSVVTGANNATLDGFTLTAGNADGAWPNNIGGGIYNPNVSPTLRNLTISGNQASGGGGGVYNSGGTPSFSNVTVIGNRANNSGGGVYNNGGTPSFSNVTISGNQANLGGGVLNNNSNASFTNVTLSGNQGGGVVNQGGTSSFSNVTISDNQGGGVVNQGGTPSFSNVTISGNQASGGGGVYNSSGGTPSFSNVTISGNQANWNGGGVYNWNSSPIFTNVTISGNQATNDGGGVYNNGGTPSFSNVTLSGNQAIGGGGVYNAGGTPSFANSIIWGNNSQVSGSATYSYSLVEGETLGGTNLPGTTNPRFVNPILATAAPTTIGNYRLQLTSSLINAGDNGANSSLSDLDGNPRIVGGTIDLGPYEVPFPSVLSVSRASASPTNAATVAFTVAFNMPVSGVDAGDFVLATTDGQNGATISSVTGSATTWVVSVTTVAEAEGMIGLNLVDNDTIVTTDSPPVPLGGSGAGNGNFTGEVYTVDRVAPTVTLSSSAPNPTNSTIPITATFSENVSGFVAGDVTVTNGSASGFTGSGATYNFTVTATNQGEVTINVAANVATDAAGNGNTAATALSRTYDSLAPTVTLSSPAPNPTNSSTIPVTVTFSKAVSNFVTTDVTVTNGSVSGFTGSGATYNFTVTATNQGEVTINVAANVAQDAAGNGNTAATELTRTYDSVAPSVTLDAPTVINAANAASYPISGTCTSGDGAVSVALGSANGSGACDEGNFSLTLDLRDLADGTHTISVSQTDAAGNEGSANADVLKDTVAPTLTISAPALPLSNSGPVSYTVSVDGAASYRLAVGDVTLHATGTATGSVTISGSGPAFVVTIGSLTGDGTLAISIAAGAALDAAGNPSSAAGPSASFTVDNTPPSASVVSGPPATSNLTPTWTWTAQGGGNGSFRYQLNDGAFVETTATSFTPSSPLAEGSHTLHVQERDDAGNWSASGSFTILIDTSLPNITISSTAPITAATVASYVISGSCSSDAGMVELAIGTLNRTAPCDNASYRVTLDVSSLADSAALTINASQSDAAGNTGRAVANVIKDTVAPTTTISSGPSDPSSSGSATFVFTANDGAGSGVASFACALNDAPFAPCSSPVTLSDLAPGNYTFAVRALDQVGNQEEVATTWRWSVSAPEAPPTRYHAFLPLVMRPSAPVVVARPDLVVEAITSSNGDLSITIANLGPVASSGGFWLDLAINPTRAPVAVNDGWDAVGNHGLAWAITRPLAAGERLTLRIGDRFYRADYSRHSGSIAAGALLYAHVDAISLTSEHGGIYENHEASGGSYNNILGPVIAASSISLTAAPGSAPAASDGWEVPLR
ncbi:MAG: hypothetical protein EI684_21935 [Candidatus Viridilinea halotolerans]|uniref:DUF1565 domain-containing protein n=1 Tax=Candidatus Viridilinea halotolerans TaxID=2491704 RepID=A0A426TR31_9CHLR|nr:MAG: hypothetical protein EI684_21935 [Candidatus Viridilinea halotolerans]